jgi:hypothetical protein
MAESIKKIQSFKEFFRIPHGTELKNFLRRMVILLRDHPNLGYQVLQDCQLIINNLVAEYREEKPLVGKNQFIAVIGDMAIPEDVAREFARELGLTKSNIRFYTGYKLSSEDFDAVSADNCLVVIMGPIPHKTIGNFEQAFQYKIIKAKTRSGDLKITKDSFRTSLEIALKKIS